MINNILNRENSRGTANENLCSDLAALFAEQKEEWPFLNKKFNNLNNVEVREINFGAFSISLQYNPDRIHSTSADIDKHLVLPKECFLCADNRPKEQRGIQYGKQFELLCNPYPILSDHFTVVKLKHTSQSLVLHLKEFLNITSDLGERFTLFYNGPRCGASAPGHMHFQAITKNVLPIEKDFESLRPDFVKSKFSSERISINLSKNYMRYFISIESSSLKEIVLFFKTLNIVLKKLTLPGQEPLMNVLANYENNTWRLIIFPRAKHRPSHYFETGERQIIVSPAAVDLGGLMITPRKEDFDKITKEDVTEILRQVTVTKEMFEYLLKKLS
jgi:ATP adenylyltransferase/5',5'''-P-1,P-4-tetraphosphate phosphorylase II